MFFKNFKVWETELAGRKLTLETGKMAGLANALEESGQVSGSAGLVVSICMLCGGMVSIVSRKNNSKGTNIALLILFGLATLTGFILAGNYSDLYLWSAWCLINVVLAFISLRKGIRN